MSFRVVALCLVASCGRIEFKPHADDAVVADTVAIDAPMLCMPLPTETYAQCQAAFADPAAATDQVIYDCAASCAFGRCVVNGTCSTCACQAYVASHVICNPVTGACGAPLSGTGCLGFGFYAGPPLDCPSTMGLPYEGACILRQLVADGDC